MWNRHQVGTISRSRRANALASDLLSFISATKSSKVWGILDFPLSSSSEMGLSKIWYITSGTCKMGESYYLWQRQESYYFPSQALN